MASTQRKTKSEKEMQPNSRSRCIRSIKWSMVWVYVLYFVVISDQYAFVGGTSGASHESDEQTCQRNQGVEELINTDLFVTAVKEMQPLQEQIKALLVKLEHLEEDQNKKHEKLESKFTTLETSVTGLTARENEFGNKLADTYKQIADINSKTSDLDRKLTSHKGEIMTVSDDINQLNQTVKGDKESLSNKIDTESKLQSKMLDEFKHTTEEELRKLKEQDGATMTLVKSNDAAQNEKDKALESKLTTMESTIEMHKMDLIERNKEVSNKLTDADNKIADLNSKTSDLDSKLTSQKGEIKTVSDDLSQLRQTETDETKRLSDKIDDKSQQHTQQLDEFKHTSYESWRKLKEQDGATESLVKSNDVAINQKYTSLEDKVNQHESKLDTYQEEIQNKTKQIHERISAANKTLKTAEDEIKTMTDRLRIHEKDLTTAFDNLFKKDAAQNEKNKALESKLTTLESNIEMHQMDLIERNKEVSNKLTDADNKIADLNSKTSDLDSKLTSQKGEIKTVSDDLNQLRQTETDETKRLSDKIDDKSQQHTQQLDEFKHMSSESLRKLEEQDGATESLVKSNDVAINQKYTSLEDKVNQHESKLDTYQEEIQNKTKQIHEKISAANRTLITAEDKIKNMTDRLRIHEEDLTTAFDNLFRKEVAIFVIVLLLVTNFGLIVAVYILCQQLKSGGKQLYPTRRDGSRKASYYNPVLDQIPPMPTLQKAIGVISFSREYQPNHQHLVTSVTDRIEGRVKVNYHVILSNEDISKIPHYSMIVFCIEYSDRDVIIEESGYGLGDCNKTTLAAAEKIGAVPVIVYCKDLGSQRLPQGKLYRPSIRCATMQEELKPLSSANRFFSVYDDFSEAQKVAFEDLIQRHAVP